MKTLERHYISKIEGHGHLKVDLHHNKVDLIIDEGERYFEKLVVGRRYEDAPYVTSRICGVCPISHQMASIKAIEAALGIEVNETIKNFRRILMAAQAVQSHTLHLYFLALPDYLGIDSAMTLAEQDPQKLSVAFDLKRFADSIIELIGGKAIHPTTPTIGGFLKLPQKNDIEKLKNSVENNLKLAQDTISLFARQKYPEFSNKTEYLSLDKYDLYEGKVISSIDSPFEPWQYKKRIKESVDPPSSAKTSLHHGKNTDHFPAVRPFMTGALARINNHSGKLNSRAKIEKVDYFKAKFPSHNPFHNNIAQAIEILHALENIIKISEKLIKYKWQKKMIKWKAKKSTGTGAVEAPRGVLYHWARTGKNGEIKEYDIVPPTAQSLANLEADAKELIKINKDISSIKRKNLLEMLVRAYDPCITCSVH